MAALASPSINHRISRARSSTGYVSVMRRRPWYSVAVIATAVGGNLDAVADGQSGLLVPPRNSAALGNAVLDLAADPQRRGVMGQAARDRTLSLFSQAACAARYERLYRGLIQPAGRSVQAIIDGADQAN